MMTKKELLEENLELRQALKNLQEDIADILGEEEDDQDDDG